MATTRRVIHATPEEVFAVLADGWLFPSWVVGASRMRSVDPNWPHVGSELRHSFGVWPFVLNDDTTALRWDPPHHFVVRPEGWPLGAALVSIEVRPHRDGARVRMTEKPVSGPVTLVPRLFLWLPLVIRNREALHRLAFLAEGKAGRPSEDALIATDVDRRGPRRRRPVARIALAAAGTVAATMAVGATAVLAARGRSR